MKDSENPSKDTPWPLLASSPYAELSLNEHYDTMYENHPGGMLLQNAYPYVLDSYSWPNTITAVARKLEPSCQVAYGEVHWQREITYNGETRIYGWAGEGTSDPIYSDQVEELYLFDGSSKDWFNPKAATTKACFDKLYSYNEIAKENKTKYADLIEGDTFVNTIAATGGTWIRVYVEGFLGGDRNFAYMLPMPRRNGCSPASDCWVDGRYISNKEIYVAGAKFSEHPTASIVAHDVQFTDDMGVTHKQDVRYDYDNATDSWIADYYAYNFNSEKNLPANLRLTRAQVKAMKPDANTMRFPTHCLIYDGSAKPGTPSDIVTVKLRITESSSFTLMDWAGVGEPYALPSASSFLGRTDDYPTGRQFKAWKVGSKLYEEGQTYTPKKDFEAVGTWKRFYAFMSDYYHVKAYVGSDETAKGRMYCAFYDAEGRLLATQFQELKAGETAYLFGDYDIYNAGAAQARLFMVDGNLIPLGDREIVEIK